MEVDVKVHGLAELEARLIELGALHGERAMRRVLRKVAAPVQERAAQNASAIGKSRSLAAAVKVVLVKPESPDEVARVSVAPRSKDRTAVFVHNAYYDRKRKGIFHGHFLEFGHRIGTSKGRLRRPSRALTEKGLARYAKRLARPEGVRGKIKGRESSGTVNARPWLGPAVRATQSSLVPNFERELRLAIARLERRRGRKAADPDAAVPS